MVFIFLVDDMSVQLKKPMGVWIRPTRNDTIHDHKIRANPPPEIPEIPGPLALEYQALLVNTLGASPWAPRRCGPSAPMGYEIFRS